MHLSHCPEYNAPALLMEKAVSFVFTFAMVISLLGITATVADAAGGALRHAQLDAIYNVKP